MRRPRFWRTLGLLLLLGAVAVGVLVWRIARDRAQLTALIQDAARDALALDIAVGEPADVAFWPHLGVRLREVTVRPLDGGAPLLTAQALDADVPWSALWAQELRLGELSLNGVRVDAAQLDRWVANWRGADTGPPASLRWPRLQNRLVIRDASWVGARTAPSIDAELSAVAPGQPLNLTLDMRGADASRLRLELTATPSDRPEGIALDGIVAQVFSPDAPEQQLRVVGAAHYGHDAFWRVRGQVQAQRWPSWLQTFAGVRADAPVRLDVQLFADGVRQIVRASGNLGGTQLDGSMGLDAWPDTSSTEATLAYLAAQFSGSVRVDRIELDGVKIEGIQIDSDDAATADNAAPTGDAHTP
jgi:uncharacterized protein involved in outer membrane biogenesis